MSLGPRHLLAVLAISAGALAAAAGSPRPLPASDELDAPELAAWLRARRAGLLLVDARSGPAADQERLPGALPLNEIDAVRLAAATTVVVYAETAAGADSLAALRRLSSTPRYLRLHGGAQAWQAQVLFPVVRSDASARQQQVFETRAALSRYFGGTPRRLEPGETVSRIRSRRGC